MKNRSKVRHPPQESTIQRLNTTGEEPGEPDWESECEVCGTVPIVPETGLCGPCTFGESETTGGNW